MAIPDYQSIMLPLLKLAGDKQDHSIREAIDHVSDLFGLTEGERKELLPSGQQPIIDNRVGWARTYLKKAGLLESPRRSYFTITTLGAQVLEKNLPEINVKFLDQFPQFIEFTKLRTEKDDDQLERELTEDSSRTPQELLEYGYQKIRKDLAQETAEPPNAGIPAILRAPCS